MMSRAPKKGEDRTGDTNNVDGSESLGIGHQTVFTVHLEVSEVAEVWIWGTLTSGTVSQTAAGELMTASRY